MSDKLQLPNINQKHQVHNSDNVINTSLADGDFIIKLNVGGVRYATLRSSLCKFEHSLIFQWFKDVTLRPTGLKSAADQYSFVTPPNWPLLLDENGYIFVDRDGDLFYYILDFLRNGNLCLPPNYGDRQRLHFEAKFLKLDQLTACVAAAAKSSLIAVDPTDYMLTSASGGGAVAVDCRQRQASHQGSLDEQMISFVLPRRLSLHQVGHQKAFSSDSPVLISAQASHITVGYHGTFAFGPQGLASSEMNFRKISRILVCGRVSVCQEVFGQTLNDSRDPCHSNLARNQDRYSSRFFLKHNVLELAFDALTTAGFKMTGCCSNGVSNLSCKAAAGPVGGQSSQMMPGSTEEDRWAHYSEFIFFRS